MSTPEVPGDAPAVDPAVAPDPTTEPPTTAEQIAAVDVASGVSTDSATTEPTVIDAPDPAVAAVASGDIDVALIAFRGGPRDSTTGLLSHDIVTFVTDTGETYTRSDQQEGNFRIYTFTPPEGGTPEGTRTTAGVDIPSKLEEDLAAAKSDADALVAADEPVAEAVPVDPTVPGDAPAA